MRRTLLAVTLVLIGLAGFGVAVAGSGSPSTGTVSICATASVPAQTVAANGNPVGTIPGASNTQCATTTYTIPTVTETVGSTTASTTTAPTTTTTLGPAAYVSSDPPAGSTISGTVNWTVQTSGDVASVEFWSDNVRLCTDTTAPWSCQLDTTKQTDGPHAYGLALVDSAGNRTTPQVGTFMVANGTTTTQTTTTTTATPTSGTVNERIDWETGDLSQAAAIECPSQSKDLALRTDIVRKGKYAIWLHIDSQSGLWNNGIPRCLYNGSSTQGAGNDYYYGLSFRLAHAQTDDIWELHQPATIYNIDGCAVAPFALFTSHYGSYNGTYFRIATGDCTSAMAGYATGWPHQEMNIPLPDLQPEPIGVWIDIVVHIRFSEASDGLVEVWYRTGSNPYKLELRRSGIPTTQYSSQYNVHDAQLYMQAGMYPGAKNWTGDDEIYEDEYKRGTTFDAVAP